VPTMGGGDQGEADRLRSEVERYRDEIVRLEQDLASSKGEAQMLAEEVNQSAKPQTMCSVSRSN